MPQCEQALENNERCSNQALPGDRFCRGHRPGGIVYRPLSKPAPPPAADLPTPAPAPVVEALPSAAGKVPSFPGLRADERGVLVGPEGVVWLEEPSLGRFVCELSQTFALPGRVRLFRHAERGALVILRPTDVTPLSAFYDLAEECASRNKGNLFVGQGDAFVAYRDGDTARGYDVPAFQVGGENKLLLFGPHGSERLRRVDLTEVPLADLCLSLPPVPHPSAPIPSVAHVLAPQAMGGMLARYFRAHHLHFGLARLRLDDRAVILFEIASRAGRPLPAFVVDHLTRLPRVVLFTTAHESGSVRIVAPYRRRPAWRGEAVFAAFASGSLVLLATEHSPAVQITPAPTFFDGDLLIAPGTLAPTGAAVPDDGAPDFEVPLRICPDRGPSPPIGAVVLSAQEVVWLRRLSRRLPGPGFTAYALCRGNDLSVLVGGRRPIEGVPFGQPLRRVSDTNLFIPLRSRFLPDLPAPLLCRLLEVRDGQYTFLTESSRIDLPVSRFLPLSDALAFNNPPRVRLTLAVPEPPLELRWTAPPPPEPAAPVPFRPLAETTAPPVDVNAHLRQQARDREQAGDFLSAAVLFGLLDDAANAARCYLRAAGEES